MIGVRLRREDTILRHLLIWHSRSFENPSWDFQHSVRVVYAHSYERVKQTTGEKSEKLFSFSTLLSKFLVNKLSSKFRIFIRGGVIPSFVPVQTAYCNKIFGPVYIIIITCHYKSRGVRVHCKVLRNALFTKVLKSKFSRACICIILFYIIFNRWKYTRVSRTRACLLECNALGYFNILAYAEMNGNKIIFIY